MTNRMVEADDSYSIASNASYPDSVSEQEWDARRYLYSNGVAVTDGTLDVTKISHSPNKFEFDIRVGNINTAMNTRGPQLIGEFIMSSSHGLECGLNFNIKPGL